MRGPLSRHVDRLDELRTCGTVCAIDLACVAGQCIVPPPRQIAPLSGASTSDRPTLRWLGSVAHLEICADRACRTVEATVEASGSSFAPEQPLGRGVHFWRVRSPHGEVFGPAWQFWVGAPNRPPAGTCGTTLDVNGDGFADIAVNNPQVTHTARLYLGGRGGPDTEAITIRGPDQDLRTDSWVPGFVVAPGGDWDGNGYTDVVGLGSSTSGSVGMDSVLAYSAGPGGLGETPRAITLDDPRFASIAPAGDINGDGYGDVIAGADGIARVYLGGPSGLIEPPREIRSPETFGNYATAVAGAGDLDGDGYADIAIGANGGTGASPGHVYVYRGSETGPVLEPTILTGVPGEMLGDKVACAGDVNGDGFGDLVAAGMFANVARVYLGSARGISMDAATTLAIADRVDLGGGGDVIATVAGAGDIDGDGFAEVTVGVEGSRSVFVWSGSANGIVAAPVVLTVPFSVSSTWAFGPGDVSGDGYDDFVFGGEALAFVVNGGAAGLASSPTRLR